MSWPTMLGYVPLLLLVAGFREVFRQPVWLALAVVALVFSLGPTLSIGGRNTGVPLPSGWISDLPVLFMLRKPDRFILVMQLQVIQMQAGGDT